MKLGIKGPRPLPFFGNSIRNLFDVSQHLIFWYKIYDRIEMLVPMLTFYLKKNIYIYIRDWNSSKVCTSLNVETINLKITCTELSMFLCLILAKHSSKTSCGMVQEVRQGVWVCDFLFILNDCINNHHAAERERKCKYIRWYSTPYSSCSASQS